LRWGVSLNRHKIWPDCENGLKKEACAGLKALCQRMGCYSPCRGMYLELRRRPVRRKHARPQLPAGSPRHGGGAEAPAPVPVGVTGHRTQRPRGQVGHPGPHSAQPSSSLNPGGERRPTPPPLAPRIAQLVPGGGGSSGGTSSSRSSSTGFLGNLHLEKRSLYVLAIWFNVFLGS
jgi:hypothetical protein